MNSIFYEFINKGNNSQNDPHLPISAAVVRFRNTAWPLGTCFEIGTHLVIRKDSAPCL